MAEEKKASGSKCKKSKSGARKALTAKAGRRRPSHIAATTNAYGERVYAAAPTGQGTATNPEQRKRGRKLSALFALRQPQYPREEAEKDERGNWVRRQLPPQPRATKAEFLAPAPVGWGMTGQLIHNDVKARPAMEAADRERMASWRMRPTPANERIS